MMAPSYLSMWQIIEDLLYQAEQLRWSDYTEVIALSEQALELAREINDVELIARSLNNIGWGHKRLSNYDKAVGPAKEAIDITRQHNLCEAYGYALLNLHVCYLIAGHKNESLAMVEELIALAEKRGYPELLAIAYCDMGLHFAHAGEYELYLYYQEKGLEVTETYQLTKPRALNYLHIARAHLQLNHFEEAVSMAHLGLEDAQTTGFTAATLSAFNVLANIHLVSGDLDQALRFAQAEMNFAQELNSNLAGASNLIGRVLLARGDKEGALAYFEQGRAYSDGIHLGNFSEASKMISQIYEERGDYQQALQYHKDAIESINQADANENQKRVDVLKTLHALEAAEREAALQKEKHSSLQSEIEERLKRQRAEILLHKELELSKIRSHILMRLSHEFRTPLTILRSSFDILTRYEDRINEQQKQRHYGRIDTQFRHIELLLDDILDVLGTLNQMKVLKPSHLYLNDICHSAMVAAHERTRTQDRIQLSLQSLPNTVFFDRDVILQIMVQLLTNAIKFSKDTVYFDLSSQGNNLRIKISDTGIGIVEEEQEAVFEVLIRGSNFDEVPGNGIGLALVRHNVDLLSGTLTLQSESGKGTTFVVDLPYMPEDSLN